tara:strand:+ start:1044 stop:1508 length:465 start_codon:yes stop_codon:yes gene_type:complete
MDGLISGWWIEKMRAAWLSAIGLAALLFAVNAADACACIHEPGLACASVSANDKDPAVRRKFEVMFRDGYVMATTCSDKYGPSRYLFTTKIGKGADGICRYRQEEYSLIASDGKYLWYEWLENGTTASRVTGSFSARPNGECPEVGDPLYKRES